MASAHYVYAIVRRDAPLPTAGGAIAGIELSTIAWRELAAVTRAIPFEDTTITPAAVLHHESVVEAVRERSPALPVRFGTVFSDARSIALALAERYEPLAADLDRVGDKVELSLTALWASPVDAEVSSVASGDDVTTQRGAGAHYLHARAAEFRRVDAMDERARAIARELEDTLGKLALERRLVLRPTPRVAVRVAYLLEPSGVSVFRAAVDALRRSGSSCRLILTGPWPPYSFVGRASAESAIAPMGHVAAIARHLTTEMQERPG